MTISASFPSILLVAVTVSTAFGFVPLSPHYHNRLLKTPSPQHPITSSLLSLNADKKLSTDDNDVELSEDEDYHHSDPASTTPQLLAGLWHQITQVSHLQKGETVTVVYPQMQNQLSAGGPYLSRLMGHLDNCKDVCDHFGIRTLIQPHVDSKKQVLGFTAKSFADPEQDDDGDDVQFEYDPFWNDEDIGDYTGIDDEEDEKEGIVKNKYPEIENRIPSDDDEIVDLTKSWVKTVMSDMGVCPFTSGAEQAGLPMGPVFYKVDRCSGIEEMYLSYWKEVIRVEQNPESDLSTTLLITPEFMMDNVELFESFSGTLTQPLTTLGIEDLLQLVFFHPQWTFRDGGNRAEAAANYARRSPWPMINILRTKQVRAAQKGIPTGLVYTQNEKTLDSVGVDKLETMLRQRDWSGIDVKVDRRDMEALRVAQDFQQTGVVKNEDLSFEGDATPAANKVDTEQMAKSDLVNVVKQALQKRLGLDNEGDGHVRRLSGPETSAAMMASDVILGELDDLATKQQGSQPIMGGQREENQDEVNVLFGGGGIPMSRDDDAPGINQDSFY